MERINLQPRPDWQQRVESVGLHYHSIDGAPYWDESVAYRFRAEQIDTLEQATQSLYELALAAVQQVIDRRLFGKLQIPVGMEAMIVQSWERDDHSLYGRFDLVYDGVAPPKMLEFNADTPTALLEASVAQWFWLQDRFPQADQFNSIHEQLIVGWSGWNLPPGELVHFAGACDSPEDRGNLEYLADTALQAGLTPNLLDMSELGWHGELNQFVDLAGRPIRQLFKLYPWEWMVREEFGIYLARAGCRYLEPPWKMVLSNKGLLALMWELAPNHPNLLPTYFEPGRLQQEYVRKPLYSREGANISIHSRRVPPQHTPGSYGEEGHVWQQFSPLPDFGGAFPVIGSWVVNHEACGIGIREDCSLITTDGSRFVPHYFEE